MMEGVNSDWALSDAFEQAALRTKNAVQPAGGRPEGPITDVLANAVPETYRYVDNLAGRAVKAAEQHTATGDYNPAPFVETAANMVGFGGPAAMAGVAGHLGAAGGVPFPLSPGTTAAIRARGQQFADTFEPSTFLEMAKKGKIHQAVDDVVKPPRAQLEAAKSPVDFGRLYGYSEDDIAHFYMQRAGGNINRAYNDYVWDLAGANFGREGGMLVPAGGKPGIKAYHVSPHNFDKFDLSKIGTIDILKKYGLAGLLAPPAATALHEQVQPTLGAP